MRRQSYRKSYSAIHIHITQKPTKLEGVRNQRVECVGRLNNRETAQPELSSSFMVDFPLSSHLMGVMVQSMDNPAFEFSFGSIPCSAF